MSVEPVDVAPLPRRQRVQPPADDLLRLPQWPLWMLFAGFPVFWVLGLGGFAPQIAAVPMVGYLLTADKARMPRALGIWIIFLAWVLTSGLAVHGKVSTYVGFGFRLSQYVAAVIIFIYVYNSSRHRLTPQRLAWMMIAFLAFVAAAGYLGIIAPHGSLTTPFEKVLPASVASNDLVGKLVHPPFAQLSPSIYVKIPPRPTAPFPYTNNWGANFAVLVPFVIIGLACTRNLAVRIGLIGLLAFAAVPAIATLNRGMMFALAVGIVYAAIRFAMRGHGKALVAVIVVIGAGLVLMSVLNFGQRLSERESNSNSGQTRTELYHATYDATLKSPLLGFGTPKETGLGGGPTIALGTQGQFWTVLYSQGFPGALLFLGGFIVLAWRSKDGVTVPHMWMHVTVIMTFVLMPFYGLAGTELVIVMAAAAMCLRDRPPRRPQIHPTMAYGEWRTHE